jgi:hypothetical protein
MTHRPVEEHFKIRQELDPTVAARMPIAERLQAFDSELSINTNLRDYISLDFDNGTLKKNAVDIWPDRVSFLSYEAARLRDEFRAANFKIEEFAGEEQHPTNKVRVAGVELADIEKHPELFRRATVESKIFIETN